MVSGFTSVANVSRPLVVHFLGEEPPINLSFWDGSYIESQLSKATLKINTPNAFRRLLYAPAELGLARAYITSEIDIQGDIFDALNIRQQLEVIGKQSLKLKTPERLKLIKSIAKLGAFGPPLKPPPEEMRPGLIHRAHTKENDSASISHHYDVSNDFYALFLGKSMTYSCAFFKTPELTLDEAQNFKYELISNKLGLTTDMKLLDIGCGWGGMLIYACQNFGVDGVGITLSKEQAAFANKKIRLLGLEDKITVRIQDYRDISGETFDAISSIGMFEHVGLDHLKLYFTKVRSLLKDSGRFLNHGISRPFRKLGFHRNGFNRNSFINRYVFPDGELIELGAVVSAMQECGFEVRDVESLREHYALTLKHWVRNLESQYEKVVDIVGENRARTWRLYMAASQLNFEQNRTSVHQILGVSTPKSGASGMPLNRLAMFNRKLFEK